MFSLDRVDLLPTTLRKVADMFPQYFGQNQRFGNGQSSYPQQSTQQQQNSSNQCYNRQYQKPLSTDSLLSTSVGSHQTSTTSVFRSDVDLSMSSGVKSDTEDDFFDLSNWEKERSSSFGGVTQYSSLRMQNNCMSTPIQHQTSRTLTSTDSTSTSKLHDHHQLQLHQQPQHLPNRLTIRCAEERIGPMSVMNGMSGGGGGPMSVDNGSCGGGVAVGATTPTLPLTPTRLGADTMTSRTFLPSPDDGLDDLPPMARDRCHTWPLKRPTLDINAQTSPLIHEQIPEEDNDCSIFDSSENVGRLGALSAASVSMVHSPEANITFSPGMISPVLNGVPPSGASDSSDPGCPNGSKKSTTRRNAWGNLSYADLITQAIMQSPDKRLTLSQVYEWMVQNVPYFRDKGDSNSSAGWKNSIRHNLSLHSRFMRIQNEGAGKSSWWVINPDAKPGRNPRRQRASTMDSTNKNTFDKRTKARKRVKELRMGGVLPNGVSVSSLAGSTGSIMSHDIYGDEDSMQASFDPMFRPRTQSTLSVPGSSARVSPSMDHQSLDDFEFPSWVESAVPINDILDRTDQMRIDACQRTMVNGNVKQETKPPASNVKTEGGPPPSYHELNSVRGPSQLQNPLLRNHQITSRFPQQALPLYQTYNWIQPSSQLQSGQQSCAAQQSVSVGNSLPIDLENLTLPDQPLMEMDVESLLRHELAQTRDHQIHFDI